MPTPLPSISARSSNPSTPPPADPSLFSTEKPVPDETLGLSGFHAQGAALRRSGLGLGPTSSTGGGTSNGGTASAATPTGAPNASSRYGPSYAKLGPAMSALDTLLRGALDEQVARNSAALQAIRESMKGPGDATPSKPVSQLLTNSLPNFGGALFHARNEGASDGPSSASASPAQRPKSANARPASAGSSLPAASTVRAAPLLAPRWGATEGGRDTLGWVRHLVRYTETHPFAVTAGGTATAAAADERAPDVAPDSSGSGFRRTVFPSLKPDRREDAVLLAKWLEDMVAQLSTYDAARLAQQVSSGVGKGAGSAPGSTFNASAPAPDAAAAANAGSGALGGAPITVMELADGVLHVYGVAMEELRRQVSSECRERGELMATLWDHTASVLALRVGLEGEARLGAMQSEYADLMAAKDELKDDVALLEAAAVAADKEARAAAAAATTTTRSLAGKLAAAQARSEEVAGAWRVTDGALKNEVERRLAVEATLATTKALLEKSEHEWLAFRAQAEQLAAANEVLQLQLEEAQADLDVSAAALASSRREFEALAAARSAQEVDMLRMKHEFETDEILVVALRQQVRDLEAQLAQLKAFQRDQALTLSREVTTREDLEADKAVLEGDLGAARTRVSELETQLSETEVKLASTQASLELKTFEYDSLTARAAAESERAAGEISGLETELQQTTHALVDTQNKLDRTEIRLKDAEMELGSLKEMLISVARTLDNQGGEGVAKADDKGWNVPGPLGAAQRTVMQATRQLGSLWERLEALRREVATNTERLAAEAAMQQKLQSELYGVRTQEAEALRAKAALEMDMDVVLAAKRALEFSEARLKEEIEDLQAQLKMERDGAVKMQAEVARLGEFEPLARSLGHQVEDLRDELHLSREALGAAKVDNASMAKQNESYVKELDKMLAQHKQMVDQVHALRLVELEAVELRDTKGSLLEQVAKLESALDTALQSHADSLHQLELARFFLKGLDLAPGATPPESVRSLSPNARPASSVAGSQDSAELHPSWRPGTAPAHFPARSARPGSARPQSASTSRPGTPDVQFLNVSPLTLVPEEDEMVDLAGAGAGAKPRPGGSRPMLSHHSMGRAQARDMVHQLASPSRQVSQSHASILAIAMGNTAGRPRPDSALGSRPLSAVSMVSDADSIYDSRIPDEVITMMEARGLADRLGSSASKWQKFKVQILAYFANRLRAQLVKEREKSAELELELARAQIVALEQAVSRERFITEELVTGLRGAVERVRHDATTGLALMRDLIPDMYSDLEALGATTTVMGVSLRDLMIRRANRKDVEAQTGEALSSRWASYIHTLPLEAPQQPLSGAALGEAIVRIYMRAVDAGGDPAAGAPAWGRPRHDTVYDAILDHYTSQKAPGVFLAELLVDIDSPVGRLLRCVRANTYNSTRVATFAALTGLSPDGTVWSPDTWHFLLQLLNALRMLLAGTWRTTLRAWGTSPNGAPIPIQAVYDLVGNLYNVQTPTDLTGPVAQRLSALVTPGAAGPVVDLDALLLLLLAEHHLGTCPASPLLFPRRLTDGALFNIFNALGHAPHGAALGDGRSVAAIATSPPVSPGRRDPAVRFANRAAQLSAPMRPLDPLIGVETDKAYTWQPKDGAARETKVEAGIGSPDMSRAATPSSRQGTPATGGIGAGRAVSSFITLQRVARRNY